MERLERELKRGTLELLLLRLLADEPTYGYQLDAFLAAVNDGAPLYTDGEDGARQMAVIDRCYEAAGLPLRGHWRPRPMSRRSR